MESLDTELYLDHMTAHPSEFQLLRLALKGQNEPEVVLETNPRILGSNKVPTCFRLFFSERGVSLRGNASDWTRHNCHASSKQASK